MLSYVTPIEGTDDLALHEATGRIAIDARRPPFRCRRSIKALSMAMPFTSRISPTSRRVCGASVASRRFPIAQSLDPGETVKLLTGAPIPAGVCGVVMEEKVRFAGSEVMIDGAIESGMNIRRRGEDVEQGSEIVDAVTLLDARHIAILAAAGTDRLTVRRRIRVAVMSTGDELVAAGTTLADHQLNDANGPMLTSSGFARQRRRSTYLGGIRTTGRPGKRVRTQPRPLTSLFARVAFRAATPTMWCRRSETRAVNAAPCPWP